MNNAVIATKVTTERNYGMDIFRLLSMFMVVLYHVVGWGGLLNASETGSLSYYLLQVLEAAAYGCVDCFALASGYLMINKKMHYSKILPLYLQVFLYNVAIALSAYCFDIGTVGVKGLILSLFPIITGNYWYFTAYFCMFFFIPFINQFFNTLTKKQAAIMMFTMFVLFSVVPTVTSRKQEFGLDDGFSPLWLTVLYLLGAYIKRFEPFKKLKPAFCLLLYACSVLIMPVSYFVIGSIGLDGYKFMLKSYLSVTVVFGSVMLLLFFSRAKINSNAVKKTVSFLSPMAFGVYLVHANGYVFDNLFVGKFTFLTQRNPLVLFFGTIGVSLVIFFACLAIDYVRLLLFKLFRVNQFTQWICTKLGIAGNKVLAKLKIDLND